MGSPQGAILMAKITPLQRVCGQRSLHVPVDHLEYNRAYTRSLTRHVNGSTRQNQYNLSIMPRHTLKHYIAARFIVMLSRMIYGRLLFPYNTTRPLACCHIPVLDQSYHVMMLLSMQSLSQQCSSVISCPVHASNLEEPGILVPAFHLSTSGTSYPPGGWLTPNHGISHGFVLLLKVPIDRVNHLFAMQIANR
ncbi:uncharacterized protein BO80DRAFT_64362 [Aspergillus ibericus CBS 121593]|uniref:Uncharacterized protein n=1 Tax=Aspergillus ibericus CBS 121593 TaxID=1448316 RepID=A0A395H257_9EURO|nr:hypothetical protein BO80DRAFT_64362 [Aspergillus ibericus CBS 121593]RAL01285.1 hypothetical protein BO80DRAFT_64362 [Aspergillus ibericus CBS 121593]